MSLCAIGIVTLCGVPTPIHFVCEQIIVRAAADCITVEGIYEYRNSAPYPTVLRLGIPFPIDSNHAPPTELALDEVAEDGQSLRPMQPAVHGMDVSVRFFFRPFETRRLRLRYTQSTKVPHGRYILKTTRAWRRPIERASFELHLEQGLALSSSNYSVQPLSGLGGWTRHGFHRVDFWPDQDWQFAWMSS